MYIFLQQKIRWYHHQIYESSIIWKELKTDKTNLSKFVHFRFPFLKDNFVHSSIRTCANILWRSQNVYYIPWGKMQSLFYFLQQSYLNYIKVTYDPT